MKKFFTAIVAMVLAVPSFAQFASGGFELDKNNLYYGARMGLSLGSLTGDSDASGMKGGLTLGGVIGLRVSTTTPVFLESGLYYTQRGGIDGDYKANLKYLEVPVLIKYGIEVGEGMAVLPFIGPYFSWGIGGKCENKFEGVKQKWSSFRDDNFNHAVQWMSARRWLKTATSTWTKYRRYYFFKRVLTSYLFFDIISLETNKTKRKEEKIMTQKELDIDIILENHKHWVNKDCNGWEYMRADLRNADLTNANLRNADLRNANLRNADLTNANLSDANLRNADLRNADLTNANLRNADLTNANLEYAILDNADLQNANLKYANLEYADLTNADLTGVNLAKANLFGASLIGVDLTNADLTNANLRNADLTNVDLIGVNLAKANLFRANLIWADLKDANLKDADLRGAYLSGAKNIPFIPMICPEKGSFIGFKKCTDNKIVELKILADARRSSATSRKCRCDKAKVLSITSIDEKMSYYEAVSKYNNDFIYRVGEIIEEPNFDDNRWEECSKGIHFFINRQEAVEYIF